MSDTDEEMIREIAVRHAYNIPCCRAIDAALHELLAKERERQASIRAAFDRCELAYVNIQDGATYALYMDLRRIFKQDQTK